MKNKLINIKNILRIVISLMVIVSMSKSCAKALTYEDILDYVTRTAAYYPNNSKYQQIKNAVNNINYKTFAESKNLSGYESFLIYFQRNQGYDRVITQLYNDIDNKLEVNASGLYSYANKTAYWWYTPFDQSNALWNETNQTGIVWLSPYPTSTTANNENNLVGMNYFTGELPSMQNFPTYVGMQAIPQYTYLEFDNSHIDNTAYNGNIFTYYYQGSLYNTINLKLGNIVNNDSYYYECKLLDNNNIEVGTSFVSLNLNPIDIYNDGALYIDNNQSVYVITRNITYNKQYKLVITSYYDGGSALNEDIDWFLFLPLNSVVSGETILNFGSGDGFGLIDSTGQIIDNQQQQTNDIIGSINDASEVDNIMAETLSGDISTISNDLGFSALDNPFTSFLFFVIEGVYDVLTEREDIVLSTHYKSLIFDLASTDFTIPQSELKTFVRNMLICVYIYGNYKYFHYMITLLETARIDKFKAEIGTDEFYDTDIM